MSGAPLPAANAHDRPRQRKAVTIPLTIGPTIASSRLRFCGWSIAANSVASCSRTSLGAASRVSFHSGNRIREVRSLPPRPDWVLAGVDKASAAASIAFCRSPQWISPWRSTGSVCGQGANIPQRPKRVTFGAQVNRALVYGVLQRQNRCRHWRFSTYPQKSVAYLLLYLLNLKKYRRTKHKAAEDGRGTPGIGCSPRSRGAWSAEKGKCTVRKRRCGRSPCREARCGPVFRLLRNTWRVG